MTAEKPQRYIVLDALRGLCACIVALYHFGTLGFINQSDFVQNGFLFVDFFFVLSGFVISSSYSSRIYNGFSVLKFMILRWGRLYPLHFIVLLVFLIFELIFLYFAQGLADRNSFEGNYKIEDLIYSFFLVQIFIGPDGTPWNGPSWSIAAEFWTYLVFAIIFKFLKKWLVIPCLLIAVTSAILLFYGTDRYINVGHDGAFARCLFGFAFGVVGFRLLIFTDKIPKIEFYLATIIEILTVFGVISFVYAVGAGPYSLLAPPLFACVVLIFSKEAGALSKFLSLPAFIGLGALSYSIYMVHLFIALRFVNALTALEHMLGGRYALVHRMGGHNMVGGSPLFGDLMSAVFLAIVIATSWLAYRLVEMPGQRWTRKRVPADLPTSNKVAASAP